LLAEAVAARTRVLGRAGGLLCQLLLDYA